jgi:hypothetical protein
MITNTGVKSNASTMIYGLLVGEGSYGIVVEHRPGHDYAYVVEWRGGRTDIHRAHELTRRTLDELLA